MNKREAKRIADLDATPYGVVLDGALYQVTGYASAKVIRGRRGVILTASEVSRYLSDSSYRKAFTS